MWNLAFRADGDGIAGFDREAAVGAHLADVLIISRLHLRRSGGRASRRRTNPVYCGRPRPGIIEVYIEIDQVRR
jgi:hypothetical protein